MQNFSPPHIEYFPSSERDLSDYFSIMIPSWNNLEYLQLCIAGIRKHSAYSHQIIVHLNEATDGSLAWLKEQDLDYTYSKKNIGVCYSLNAMRKLARANYLVNVSDDMYLCPGWDVYLLNEIEKQRNEYFYFSSTLIEPKPSKNPNIIAPYNFGLTPEKFEETKLAIFCEKVEKPDWFGGGAAPSVVQRKIWDQVGGYSTEFSPGEYSDRDFCMKLWQAGVRNFKGIGKSLAYHFQARTTQRVMQNDGKHQFAEKWGIPASYFDKKILRVGKPFVPGVELTWPKGLSYELARLRAKMV